MCAGDVEAPAGCRGDRPRGRMAAITPGDLGGEVAWRVVGIRIGEVRDDRRRRLADGRHDVAPLGGERGVRYRGGEGGLGVWGAVSAPGHGPVIGAVSRVGVRALHAGDGAGIELTG